MGDRFKLLLWGSLICLVIVVGAFFVYQLGALSPTEPATQPLVTSPTSSTCGTLPLDVVLVIDRSASMVEDTTKSGTPPQTRLYYAKQAATQLVDQLDQNGGLGGRSNPSNQISVVSFGGLNEAGVSVDVTLGNNDATAVKNAINNLNGAGGTPFKQAMAAAANELDTHKRTTHDNKAVQHVVIFLSDGSPDPSFNAPSPTEITNYLGSADMLYSIAIGQGGQGANGVDLDLMKKIAKPTPAKFHQVTTADALPALFSDIFTEIACKSANLSLTKTVDNAAPKLNDTVTFTLTVTSAGPDATDSVTVKDVLPAGLTVTGANPTGYDGTTWTVGTVSNGAKATLLLSVKVTAAAGTAITNVAEIMSSSVADPNSTPGNGVTTEDDYATAAITVAATAVTTPPAETTTPPAVTPTPTPTVTTPTEAPSSGLGGWGQLLYLLIGLTGLGSAWLLASRLKQARQR